MHRDALCDILWNREIPAKTIDLVTDLCSGTDGAVECVGGVSDFPVNSEDKQGFTMATSLFNNLH